MSKFSGYYLVVGPSSFSVDGFVEVLGYPLSSGGSFTVPVGRGVPVRVEGFVSVSRGVESLKPLDPRDYENVDSVASDLSSYDRIVLVGPVDSGKSTLALWISNKMFLKGLRAWYFTVDVGQNEVFCPGFEALAAVNPPGIPGYSESFSSIEPCFVGSFTPSDSLVKYLGCASKLSSIVQGPLIVDTDGWVSAPEGLKSKVELADVVKARIIVAVGLREDYVKILGELSKVEVLSLPRLVKGSKSFEERRLHRDRLLTQKLLGSRPRLVKVGETIVEGAPIFSGNPIEKTTLKIIAPNAIYGERDVKGEITIVYRGRQPNNIDAKLIPQGWEKGLLVAVHGVGVHVGVIGKVNYETKTITILTPYQDIIKKVEIGKARIDVEALTGKAKW